MDGWLTSFYMCCIHMMITKRLFSEEKSRTSSWKYGKSWCEAWGLMQYKFFMLYTSSHFIVIYNSIGSGAMVVVIGIASRWLDSGSDVDKLFMYISQLNKQRSQFPLLSNVQAILVILSSAMVWLSTSHRAQKKELLMVFQWSFHCFPPVGSYHVSLLYSWVLLLRFCCCPLDMKLSFMVDLLWYSWDGYWLKVLCSLQPRTK